LKEKEIGSPFFSFRLYIRKQAIEVSFALSRKHH